MKKTFILAAALVIMMLPLFSHAQVSSTSTADAEKSLGWARNMIKAVTGLGDDFARFKGDFVQKDGSDNSYYGAKDLDVGTDTQFVILRAKGSTAYAAIYKGADKSDRGPAMAFAAFTGGIMTLSHGDFTVKGDDTQPKGTLKYYLIVKDTKVASFTFDINENSGTLLVAIQ